MQNSLPVNAGVQLTAVQEGVIVAAPGSVAVNPPPAQGPAMMLPSVTTRLARLGAVSPGGPPASAPRLMFWDEVVLVQPPASASASAAAAMHWNSRSFFMSASCGIRPHRAR